MKNVVIISGSGINNVNSAAAARMMNYAISLANCPETKIYMFSLREDDFSGFDMDLCNDIINVLPPRKVRRSLSLLESWHLLVKIDKDLSKSGEIAYILYPCVNCLFECLFLLWAKTKRIQRIYCEINEVRKYWTRLSYLGFIHRTFYKTIFYFSERLSKFYKGLICINKHICQYYLKYNANAIIVPILSQPHDNLMMNIYKRDDDRDNFVMAFTGTIDIEKENLIEFLDGLVLFNKEYRGNWMINMYGFINDNTKKRLEILIKERKLDNNINLNGEIEHEKIPLILSESDCLVLPRKNDKQNYYGFSTKLSEYLVSGTPVVLTRTGVVGDYLSDGEDCIFVEGYSALGFKDALMRVAKMDNACRNAMAQKASATAKRYFSPSVYSETLIHFLFQ